MNKFILALTLIFSFTYSQSQVLSYNKALYFRNEHLISAEENTHPSIRNFETDIIQEDTLNKGLTFSKSLFKGNEFEFKKNNFNTQINALLINKLEYKDDNLNATYGGGIAVNMNYKKWSLKTNLFAFRQALSGSDLQFADSFNIIHSLGTAQSHSDNNYTFADILWELNYKASDNFSFTAGKGKSFFGNGYHSLFLSDNASPYPFLRLDVDVWKIKYRWQVGKLKDYPLYGTGTDFKLYDKYAFWHYLSIDLTKRINFNFFEVIISNPYGHSLEKQGLNISYFNPVIFYRPVEFAEGTLDNALMGLGLNIRLFDNLQLYSQFILDDMIISTLNDGSGWWGNKFGFQAGMKANKFLNINNLLFIGEINAVRPYTYAHGEISFPTIPSRRNMNLNYGAYREALAHPEGANFAEILTYVNYRYKRFVFSGFISASTKGYDYEQDISLGGDIYKSYNLRPDDNGISFLQGNLIKSINSELKINYIINPNSHLELESGLHIYKNDADISENYFFIGLKSLIF